MKGKAMFPRFPARPPGLQATPIRRRTALRSGVALPLGLLAARATPATALRSSSPRLRLPAPTGYYRIGTTTLHLVDPSRPDPWVPSQRARQLMIQLWYPADPVDGYPRAPYMTRRTARAYQKEQSLPVLNWPVTAAHLGAPARQRDRGWPVVLFSPAMGGERSNTTSLVADLASRGYVVVTIDHVHDCGVVELPGGRVATAAFPPITQANELQVTIMEVESRTADVRFILDQLTVITRGGNPDHERRPLPRGLHGALDLRRVGMFGHSDGGSATAHAMHADSRLTAGVDLDGTLWTPQAVAGSDRPLLLFGEQDLAAAEAASWAEFWTRQRGPKLQLSLTGSQHATFTDFAPLVPQVAPILGLSAEQVTNLVGTINGLRAVAVERAYIGAWFDRYLRHQDSSLLRGPSPRYPEVVFAR
jgi:predicted dienelactone hydrolase